MEDSFGTLVYLVIGYICGVFFAPDIFSANITATNWYNIWVYAWIFGWPVMLLIHFLVPLFAAPVVIAKT